jgi:low temperature requirement protein LtrA
LTSVVDPDDSEVRIVVFVAMAALTVVALCVPQAFGDLALTLAVAYGVVRAAHIALFVLASRGDPMLRRSVTGLAISTAIGVGLLCVAAFLDGAAQGAMWALALLLDMGGPFLFGSEGWKLEPSHFVERHGLVVLIALGESIVALGVGAQVGVDRGVITAATLGVALIAAMWWAYFDIGATMCGRTLIATPPGREQNELARDAYSYLHFPMIAGIVLLAVGLEATFVHLGDPLDAVPGVALVGGLVVYALSLVAFKYRVMRTITVPRVVLAAVLAAGSPVALYAPALVTLAVVAAAWWVLIAYETIRFAELRGEMRGTEEPA